MNGDCGHESEGERWKRQGNVCYAKGDFLGAIAAYTRCVVLSDPGHPERALALANRSAVLMAVGHFRDGVRDLERALDNNYPEATRFRLHLRMGICFREMGEVEKSREQYRKSREIICEYGLPEDKRKELEAVADKYFNGGYEVKWPKVEVEYLPPPALSYGENADYPGLSSAVGVEKDEYFGRKVVALTDLQIGDVIMVEEPAVSNLKNDSQWLHCSFCYKLSFCLMPCDKCKKVSYCSNVCQKQAHQPQHQSICAPLARFTEFKSTLGLSETMFLNLSRIFDFIAAFGVDQIVSHVDTDAPTTLLGRVMNLCHHPTDKNSSVEALCSAIISHCFQIRDQPSLDKLSKLSCRMLLIHQANSYSLEQVVFDAKQGQVEVQNWAYGTYPLASLMNHSCDPNLVFAFHLKNMVVRVARPVARGQQLFSRYCNSFYSMAKDERRTRLQPYNFECACEACTQNWQVAKWLPDEPADFVQEARPLADAVASLMERCQSADGFRVDYNLVRAEETLEACRRLQKVYFEPEERSRLDKLYRKAELLVYYHFGAKTMNFLLQ